MASVGQWSRQAWHSTPRRGRHWSATTMAWVKLAETENETRVPLLGDIPIAGNLFKNKFRNTNKQEMLVFITPKMVADRQPAGR